MRALILLFGLIMLVGALSNHPRQIGQLQAQDNLRIDRAIAMRAAIKGLIRDPDSVRWHSVYTNYEGTLGCFQYRARNGFGGMVFKSMAIYKNKSVNYQKHCANQVLYEIDILEN